MLWPKFLDSVIARFGARVVKDHLNPRIDYLVRTYLLGVERDARGEIVHRRFELCLHKILVSDGDFLHNHPAAFASLILCGSYLEHTPEGVFHRRPGHLRIRGKRSFHRLELVNGPVYTLFLFLNRKPGTDSDWYFLVGGRPVHRMIHLGEAA